MFVIAKHPCINFLYHQIKHVFCAAQKKNTFDVIENLYDQAWNLCQIVNLHLLNYNDHRLHQRFQITIMNLK